jgi:hypothetical protein
MDMSALSQPRNAAVAGVLTTVALLGVGAAISGPSSADTENCVSQGEYNNTTRFMSTGEVSNLYDVNGWYIGSSDTHFRRGYNACNGWTDGRVVVRYQLDTGLSDDWDVRGD